ncbi:MAG: 3-oxoacyl-ACP synthase III [Pirellulales bacterium]
MKLYFQNVCVEAFGYALPEEVVTSAEIESRLSPLYARLGLPEGRLELMTGIRERRFWPRGMLPSVQSAISGERAIQQSGIDRSEIGALLHCSVCRDYLEPATASGVHRRLGLSSDCVVYDVSNACLGLLNGMLQVANMIELGQIRAGLVVGTESGRDLVENTIEHLNRDTTLSRNDIKLAVASLTIGSGSAAVLLVDRDLTRTGNRLQGGLVANDTAHSHLCQSGSDEAAAGGMKPLMRTDSEALLHAGVALARRAFPDFAAAVEWPLGAIEKTFCHQVGQAHRKLMFQALDIDPRCDFSTVEFLGNTGAVAVPLTAALGIERGHLQPGDRVALLGIGSGINVVMLGMEWQRSLISTVPIANSPQAAVVEAH